MNEMKLSISESEFFSSVRAGDISAVKLALRPEPYLVNFQDAIGKTPLWLAVENGLIQMVKALISYGANINATDQDGNTLLHLAIMKCLETEGSHARKTFIEIASILLDSGIDINVTNNKGFSCLHNAAILGDNSMVMFLLNKGADVDLRSSEGFTPFLWSLYANIWERDIPKHLETLDILFRFGADVTAVTQDGKNSLSIAKEMNLRQQFIGFLHEHGAK